MQCALETAPHAQIELARPVVLLENGGVRAVAQGRFQLSAREGDAQRGARIDRDMRPDLPCPSRAQRRIEERAQPVAVPRVQAEAAALEGTRFDTGAGGK